MSRPALNKSSLKNQQDRLGLYEQYLPSLDLKRQQFLALVKKEERRLKEVEQAAARAQEDAGDLLPFLANEQIELQGLLTIREVEVRRVNQLGVRLPQLAGITFERLEYSLFSKPLWVDGLVELLEEIARLVFEKYLVQHRLALLREELKTITQRVNLFDKVLIPSARDNIREIAIALSDMERAGVVRAKIFKKKRQQRGA